MNHARLTLPICSWHVATQNSLPWETEWMPLAFWQVLIFEKTSTWPILMQLIMFCCATMKLQWKTLTSMNLILTCFVNAKLILDPGQMRLSFPQIWSFNRPKSVHDYLDIEGRVQKWQPKSSCFFRPFGLLLRHLQFIVWPWSRMVQVRRLKILL